MGYLQQLELVDFKSYSGRTLIGPFDPFTSIIGPNGSGKSNLMDAISFVLGVSSAKLRSANLGELVHRSSSGSNDAQKASVSAVYIDSSKQTLKFTRTVTLSGHSEYFVNSNSTSFADYSRLLESENILVKARNFLVFQGDVEAIANKTPKELTRLLEQISGSDAVREEYERLKEEHDRAVESSTFAFNKRRGLSAEIKAVQDQKEEVVRFEELLAQRQDLMTDLALLQLKSVEDQAKTIADSIDSKQAELERLQSVHEEHEKRYKNARKEYAKITKELVQAEKRLKRAATESDLANPDYIVSMERCKSIEKRISDQLAVHERTSNERLRLVSEKAALDQEIKALEEAKLRREQELQTQLVSIPTEHRLEYDRLKAQVDELSAKERLKHDTLERKVSPKQLERRQVESKLGELKLRKEQLERDVSVVSSRLVEIERAISENQQTLHAIDEQTKRNVERRRAVADEEAELTGRLQSVSARLLDQRAREEESERQQRTIDTIDALKRIFPGVYGSVIDCCQPTAKRYEQPLMAIIGGMSDAVVVEQHRVAVECIRYLREQRLPPLTFLPVDTIEAASIGVDRIRQELSGDGGRLACDLLRPTGTAGNSASVTKAIQFVCGTSVVCESLAQCRATISTHPSVSKAVSIEGHVAHQSGLLTGGQYDNGKQRGGSSKWTDKECRELKAERDGLIGRLHELGKEGRRLDAEERLSAERFDVEERLRHLDSEKVYHC
jgi:structural maintenance of chromosome 1